jgi:hypothetical protein
MAGVTVHCHYLCQYCSAASEAFLKPMGAVHLLDAIRQQLLMWPPHASGLWAEFLCKRTKLQHGLRPKPMQSRPSNLLTDSV